MEKSLLGGGELDELRLVFLQQDKLTFIWMGCLQAVQHKVSDQAPINSTIHVPCSTFPCLSRLYKGLNIEKRKSSELSRNLQTDATTDSYRKAWSNTRTARPSAPLQVIRHDPCSQPVGPPTCIRSSQQPLNFTSLAQRTTLWQG